MDGDRPLALGAAGDHGGRAANELCSCEKNRLAKRLAAMAFLAENGASDGT